VGFVRKAASAQQDPMNHYHAHRATTVKKINWTWNLGFVQQATFAMEAQSIVILSIKLMVIDVQRVIIAPLKVPIQPHALQVLMLTLNTTSSGTTANLALLVSSAQLMDWTFLLEIVLKDFTVLLGRHRQAHQTRNASLVTSAPRVADFTIHVLLGHTSRMPGKVFVISVLLEVIVILMRQDKTCHVKGMSLVG